MSVAVLVITDGRGEYLERTVASASEMLYDDPAEWWMYDDSGDDEHRAWLRERFPWFVHFDAGPRQGFGGAIRQAWSYSLTWRPQASAPKPTSRSTGLSTSTRWPACSTATGTWPSWS